MPAPRDTGQKWLAFGAIVAVAVGVSFASSAFKDHLKSSLPEPAPTERSPLVSSPPPKPAPSLGAQPGPSTDPPPADDPRTPPSGTPKSSLASKPLWGDFDRNRNGDRPVMRYAPFHARANQIFATASATHEELSKAFVVCRGSVSDDSSEPYLRVTFGAMPELASSGETQRENTYVTAPLVDVKKGQLVNATLFAKGVSGLTEVARLKARLGVDDLQKDDEAGTIECVALAGDALQDRIAKDAGRADAAIAKVAAMSFDTKSLGADSDEHEQAAKRSIGDLAALVGWADGRVKARLAAYDAAVAKIGAEERRAFDDLHRGATPKTIQGSISFIYERTACGAEDCDVLLDLQNLRHETFRFNDDEVTVNIFVARKAHKDRVERHLDIDLEPVLVPPGESRKVRIRGPASLSGAQGLAQICMGTGEAAPCGVIRLQ